MKTEHTPKCEDEGCSCNGSMELNGLRFVCDYQSSLLCHSADFPIYAAAPDLFDAIVAALPYVEMAEHDRAYKKGTVEKMVKQIREAIAKATGARPAMTEAEHNASPKGRW